MENITKLKLIKEKLQFYLNELHFYLLEYNIIFKQEEYQELRGRFDFFGDLRKMYWTYLIIKIYAFLDNESFGSGKNRKDNISHNQLLKLIKTENLKCYEELKLLYKRVEDLSKSLKTARKKAIGHNDLDFVKNKESVKVNLTTINEIIELLFTFHRKLNEELEDCIVLGANITRSRVKTILQLLESGIEYNDFELTEEEKFKIKSRGPFISNYISH